MEKLRKCIELFVESGQPIELNDSTNLISDLGLSSLSMIELIMEIENEFCINIPDEDLDFDNIIIYKNLVHLIESVIDANK